MRDPVTSTRSSVTGASSSLASCADALPEKPATDRAAPVISAASTASLSMCEDIAGLPRADGAGYIGETPGQRRDGVQSILFVVLAWQWCRGRHAAEHESVLTALHAFALVFNRIRRMTPIG